MIREIICITFVLCVSAQEIAVNDKGRIVGGSTVNIEKRPFQVAVYIGGGSEFHLCGGSIISPNNVVTAAHCVIGLSTKQVFVYAGSSSSTSGGILYNVSRIIVNSNYHSSRSNDYDVAVLDIIGARPAAGAPAIVSGWGALVAGGPNEPLLRQVTVPIVNQDTCIKDYRGTIITNNMICAGFSRGGKDACQGDSGGPLTYNDKLLGIVSFGNGCGQANKPGVYASVPQLRTWINMQTLS